MTQTQATANDIEYEEESMTINRDRVGRHLIFEQAEGIVDAWREGVQNGGDAIGSEHVFVVVQPEEERTVIWDDGAGMDLGDGQVKSFLTELATTSKADDPTAVGHFGIGFAQMMAKGRVTVRTQDWVVKFDAKSGQPLNYDIGQTDDWFDGFWVQIDHYADEVPDPDSPDWDDKVDDLKERFQFFELVHDVEIHVNGDRVSDKHPEGEYVGTPERVVETDTAVYALGTKNQDSLWVWSAGLKIGTVNGDGLYGKVVTKENLDLNMSRDKIKSGCPVWDTVQNELDDHRVELLEKDIDKLTDSGRAAVVKLMRDGHRDRFSDAPVLKQSNGRTLSYDEMNEKHEVLIADKEDRMADKLVEMGLVVLQEDDEATRQLRQGASNDDLEMPTIGSMEETVKDLSNVFDDHEEEVDRSEWPRTKLSMAIAMSEKMEREMGEPSRDIWYGHDDAANAWTYGTGTKIVLTDSAFAGSKWEAWMPALWRILCHEYAHRSDDTKNIGHNERFNEEFRDWVDQTEEVLVEMMASIARDGLFDTIKAEGVNPDQFR